MVPGYFISYKIRFVGSVSMLCHFYYGNLVLCGHYLYLLTKAFQLVPAFKYKLYGRIGKVFKNSLSLFFLIIYVKRNNDWFASNLFFNKVVIPGSIGYSSGSRSDHESKDNGIKKDNNSGMSKMKFDD